MHKPIPAKYRRFAKDFTPQRLLVRDALAEFEAQHSYPPTLRELGRHLNLSPSTVYSHLESLERQGLVSHNPKVVRGWRAAGCSWRGRDRAA